MSQIWTPIVYIDNSLNVKKLPEISKLNRLWFIMPHELSYSEVFTVWVSCNFEFHTYPFDSHVCNINLKNWFGGKWRVDLNSPKIFTTFNNNGKLNGGNAIFNLTNSRLNYDFSFESLETIGIIETDSHTDVEEMAMAQIRMNMTRNERGREYIFGAFHVPTATFASLSLASFFIEVRFSR